MDPIDFQFPRSDVILLTSMFGAMASPGRATVRGATSPWKWDVRDQGPADGAATVYMGRQLTKFEVEFAFWEGAQIAMWELFSRIMFDNLAVQLRTAKVALGFYHPVLSVPPFAVTSVVVEDVGQLVQDDTGLWTCVCKFIQWKAAKPVLAAKPMASPPAGTAPEPVADTEAKKAFAAAASQLSGLGKR